MITQLKRKLYENQNHHRHFPSVGSSPGWQQRFTRSSESLNNCNSFSTSIQFCSFVTMCNKIIPPIHRRERANPMLWNVQDTPGIEQILRTTKWKCFQGWQSLLCGAGFPQVFFFFTSFKKLSVLDRYQCDTNIKLELCGTAAAPSLNAN